VLKVSREAALEGQSVARAKAWISRIIQVAGNLYSSAKTEIGEDL